MPEPAEAAGIGRRIAFRVSLRVWSLLAPLLALTGSLSTLLRWTAPPAGAPYRGLAAAYVVHRVKRICRRPILMRDRPCLREGLLAYRFLRGSGHRPVLHFGVDRASVARSRMEAHCWVTLDGEMLLNPPPPGYLEIYSVGDAAG